MLIAKRRLDESLQEIHMEFLAEGVTEVAMRIPIF